MHIFVKNNTKSFQKPYQNMLETIQKTVQNNTVLLKTIQVISSCVSACIQRLSFSFPASQSSNVFNSAADIHIF